MTSGLHINKSGTLPADHYTLYWEDWGNPSAQPIFYLHGGPGGGFDEKSKELFDPETHHVIFHDQRGAGRSVPFADTTDNTTQHLVGDIERLREYLGYETISVMGGSWGSALALFYVLAHPERVEKFLIYGVFLARQFEVDFVNEGYPRYYFPEAWERFISYVPEEQRKTGDSVMRYYAGKFASADEAEALKYAIEWTLWEYTLCSINYDPVNLEKLVREDKDTLAMARLEAHYFLNKCFVPEGYVLNNLHTITHIPCHIVQGRFDFCTPAISAYDLAKAYGPKASLTWVNAGHYYVDHLMFDALKKANAEFFT